MWSLCWVYASCEEVSKEKYKLFNQLSTSMLNIASPRWNTASIECTWFFHIETLCLFSHVPRLLIELFYFCHNAVMINEEEYNNFKGMLKIMILMDTKKFRLLRKTDHYVFETIRITNSSIVQLLRAVWPSHS